MKEEAEVALCAPCTEALSPVHAELRAQVRLLRQVQPSVRVARSEWLEPMPLCSQVVEERVEPTTSTGEWELRERPHRDALAAVHLAQVC
jgi:hypothetical protein